MPFPCLRREAQEQTLSVDFPGSYYFGPTYWEGINVSVEQCPLAVTEGTVCPRERDID